MSKASGLFLIVAGLCAAAYAMPSGTDEADQQSPTPEIVVIKTAPPPTVTASAATVPSQIVPPVPKPAVRPAAHTAKAEMKAAGTDPANPAVVTVSQRVDVPAAVTRSAQQGGAVVIPGDRVGLTRELQRELRRVGCYDGESNGTWTPAARRAMKSFTDRVNATLPIDQPDYILLTLVQGRQERVCGAPCPSGQGMSDDGRCLPNAVIARAARTPALPATAKNETVEKPVATTSSWSTTTTAVASNLPAVPEGRMALSGPKRDALAAPNKDRAGPAAIVQTPDERSSKARAEVDRERALPRGTYERRAKHAPVQNRGARYVSVPRKKFGAWYFKQRDTWSN